MSSGIDFNAIMTPSTIFVPNITTQVIVDETITPKQEFTLI